MAEATERMLTPERLRELRRIAEAATPGPWTADAGYIVVLGSDGWAEKRVACLDIDGNSMDDEFIAAFDPPTVLAMLDALDEQEREIERLRWEHETIAEWVRDVLRISYPDEQMLTGMLESILALLHGEKGGGRE